MNKPHPHPLNQPAASTAPLPAQAVLTDVAQRLARLPAAQREQFRQLLATRGLSLVDLPIVPQAPHARQDAPLSPAQQRLWFLDQLDGPGAVYNICSALQIDGPLVPAALQRSFQVLIERHAGLRTAIVTRDGRAMQHVAIAPPLPWQQVDLGALPPDKRTARLAALGHEMAGLQLDLSQPPLLRLLLARTGHESHVLWLTLHHIVADGWSLDLLMQEAAALYAEFTGGPAAVLAPLSIDPLDCAIWQRELLMQPALLDPALHYWKATLGDEHPVLALPTDRPRPPRQSHRGRTHRFDIPAALADGLRTLTRREGKTFFALAMAAFHALLHRHAGQTDVRVGTPVANRERPETQGMIGLFLDTLVLKSEPHGAMRFDELLALVSRRLVEARARQHLPFERLVDALQPTRELSHSPLFQAMLIVHAPGNGVNWPAGLDVRPIDTPAAHAKFDLTLEIADDGQALDAGFTYASDLFDADTIARLATHFVNLLHGIVASPTARLDALPLLDTAERLQVLHGWNDTATAYPQGDWVHGLIERQARLTPDAPALFFGEQVLSYRRLNQRANQLAHELRASGVGPDRVVGVCCLRSIDMVVALLAVLKAGGAYLPLDPDYPGERLQQMLDDAGADLLLTHQAVAWRPRDAQRLLLLDDAWERIASHPMYAPEPSLQPAHLAYVIYTSGSTGRPKGVGVPHAGLLNRLQWMQAEYKLDRHDRVLQKTPFSFDVSVWEFFWPLMSGAALVVAAPGEHRDSERLAALIRERGVTTLHFVPSMLRAFLDDPQAASCSSIRRVICSGEALPIDLQQRFFSLLPAELHNLYGPTEASIDVSYWACRRDAADNHVPIGRPIANTRLLVLDAALNPVPIGVAGELFIGGIGLARGYMGRPDLSAERFIPDPEGGGGRLYRTGDLARWRADGAIDYLGRLDHQVKLRGFRIELGEIEARVLAHPAVAEAVVVAREDRPGDKRLVAYWVASDASAAPDDEALEAFLRAVLPEHMLPSAWVRLAQMPLSTNGKLDRKALPAPDVQIGAGGAPRDAREELLCEVWQDVLGLPSVGVFDNFFRLGGDSILSLQVVARARQRGLKLTPRQMFEHQTIAAAAAVAELALSQPVAEIDTAIDGTLPLTPIQHWFFDAGFHTPAHWNQAMVLTLRDPADGDVLPAALRALARHHAALRLRFDAPADEEWQQRYLAPDDASAPVEHINLDTVPAADWDAAIERHGDRLQAGFDLSAGPLWRAALFTGRAGISPRLLIAVHHLAVDGVSWRVLLDDLQLACRQLRAQTAVALPAVTTSYRQWARRLEMHARADVTRDELAHWVQTHHDVPPLGLTRGTLRSARRARVELDAARTAALLGSVPSRQRARVEDLLLTALVQVLCPSPEAAVLVELEGHGREDLFPDLDVSRTVGWFTTRYPVRLTPGSTAPLATLKSVKEQLRAVPRRGIGYGLLRYLGDPVDRARLAALQQPEICFNYLGRFDRVFHRDAAWSLADGSAGATRRPSERRTHAVDVDAQIMGDVLVIDWTCDVADDAARMAQALVDRLAALLDALAEAPCGATPSDFPLCGIDQAELDSLALPWDEVDDLYPLAPMQHGLLLHTLLNPGSGMYLMQDRYRLQGDIDPDAFLAAWERVVERHAVLRTSFHWQREDRPLQAVHARVPSAVRRDDWSHLDEEAQRERLDAELAAELEQGFALSEPRLIRFRLIHLGEGRWYFTQSYHHILIDAWCFSLLMVDFFEHYRALRDGAAAPSLPAPRPYADFIGWLGRQDQDAARQYWREALAGFDEPTPLGIDRLADSRTHQGVDDYALQLELGETAALQALAQHLQVTVNTCTQAAWALLLAWYSGRTDVLFGITVAGRPTELQGVESSVGLFINTLPLRLTVDPSQPAAAWMQQIAARNAALRHHEQLPLGDVQALSPLGRGQSLFDSLFVFENAPVDRSLDEWKLRWHIDEKHARTHTNYPLTVVIIPGERLTLQLTCDRSRFEPDAIRRMLGHFKALLLALVAQPQARLGDLPRLNAAESAQSAAWNDTGDAADVPCDLMPLFERQVALTPHAPAARCGAQTLSYAQLDRCAARIGAALVAGGIGPDDVVALHDQRGLDLLAMILGVFKAGAAYLPLDTRHPGARLAEVISLSGAALLLRGDGPDAALDDALHRLDGKAPRCWRLGELPSASFDAPAPLRRGAGRHLAYIIYTSGSTGVPKGAMVERSGMLNNLLQKHVQLGMTAQDVIAQTASACFDISVWQFLSALLCGACVDIVPDAIAQDPHALGRFVGERGVTVLECVPALLRGLLMDSDAPAHGSSSLRWVLPTGEALPPELARQWLARHPSIPLLNVYGPAECADDVALFALRDVGDAHGAHLPIGRPVANLQLLVMNALMQPVPVGVPGELCVAGIGVGRGYLNDPRRTAASFVPHPTLPGERLYRTGDLVRQRVDGVYEYLGRIDHQVKLRGHRIELGEIEARLATQPGIAQAVALVREDRPGDQRLVAYVLAGDDSAPDEQQLRASLAQTLPRPMVPSAIVTVREWPLSANGKIDRRLLPMPATPLDQGDDGMPTDTLQASLATIWAEVLGLARVGTQQDFFALGGHSLLATQVVSRIRRQLGCELPLRAVFDAPTIAALAEVVRAGTATPQALPIPPRMPGSDLSPLTFAQERMWFLAELDPASALYNLPVVLQLDGDLDRTAMARSLATLQARHAVLRSVIVRGEPYALQRTLAPGPVPLPLDDLTHEPPHWGELRARQIADDEATRPFDLATESPWRVRLLRLSQHRHWLLLTFHHIAVDGWAMGVLMRELATAYGELADGREPVLPPLAIEYADVAAWQRSGADDPRLQQQLAYWREKLGRDHEALALPTDRPRPPVQAHRGASLDLDVTPERMAALRRLGQRHGATPFMVLLAAYATLLARHSGQRDIRIGTPIANRQRVETESVVGLFANTLVLRCRFEDTPDFAALLRQVRETALGAQAHQDLPFEQLVEALQPERDLSRSPLFQALFILQNMALAAPPLDGLAVTALPAGSGSAKFDLSLIAEESADGGLRASIEYDTDLFDAATIERMAQHFMRILQHAADATPGPVADWTLFDAAAERAWLAQAHPEAAPASRLSLVETFAQQVRLRPQATALIVGDRVDERLSYAELDRRATSLAQRLCHAGVRPDSLVAICLPRSASLLVALLGVLKAGAAYVPLDPAYPADRLSWMLEDARPGLLLTDSALRAQLPSHQAEVWCLDELAAAPADGSLDTPVLPAHLAYCIYTSGSTGRPKGVQVTRGALGNLLGSMAQRLDVRPGELWLAVTSLSFDIAALELYLPLVSGGTVLLAGDGQGADAGALMRLLREHPVRTMQATPATWRLLLEAGWTGGDLRLLCGGEAMSAELADRLAERADTLWNVYGPTETTIWSTLQRVVPADRPFSPAIGHVLDNTDALVLDERLNPVPPGVAGELYLGGDGLARGYRGRPDLSAERFVPNPCRAGSRVYRTGDVVRRLADGRLQCLGRSDRQIKLRGFRIELDEIESALSTTAGVKQAAVVAFGVEAACEIVAYAVPDEGMLPRITPLALREALAKRLPGYMLPAHIVLLDALPLTPNAKVDRKALARPQGASHLACPVAPSTPAEALVANVWEELLGLARVGANDNFFHLGGHSLLAVRVMQRLRQLSGRELPLTLLFKAPTLSELARAMQGEGTTPAASPVIALRRDGVRPPLFCIHPAGGHVASYLPLVQALGPDQPVYGLQSRTLFDPQWEDPSVADMAARYVDALREVQPGGPYRLLGWSLGGLVALEMAACLEQQGERVDFLGVLDTTRYRDDATAIRHDRASDLLDQLAILCREPLPPEQRTALQRELAASAPEVQAAQLWAWAKVHAPLRDDVEVDDIELQVQARQAANRLMREHQVRPVTAPLHVWWADRTLAAHADAPMDWQDIACGGVHSTTLAADHWSLMRLPALHDALAELLAQPSKTNAEG